MTRPTCRKRAVEQAVGLQPFEAAKLLLRMFTEYFAEAGPQPNAEAQALDLLRSFSTVRVQFPDIATVERLAMERMTVRALTKDPSAGTVKRCAEVWGVPRRKIAKAWEKHAGHGITEERRRRAAREAKPL